MLLEIMEIVVSYDGAEAVKGVTINVEEGSITTFIGANGAGKSSVLRSISGLKKLNSGEIWFQGKRIDGMKPHKIVEMGIGHVPEGRRVFGLMTVMHNLKIGAYLQNDKRKVGQILEKVFHHFRLFTGIRWIRTNKNFLTMTNRAQVSMKSFDIFFQNCINRDKVLP